MALVLDNLPLLPLHSTRPLKEAIPDLVGHVADHARIVGHEHCRVLAASADLLHTEARATLTAD